MPSAPDIVTIVFYATPRHDLLSFGSTSNPLPFGSISKMILETDSHVWDQIIQIANEIIQLTKGMDCTSAKDVECFLLIVRKVFELNIANRLKKLIYYLPVQRKYLLAEQEHALIQFTNTEIREYQQELRVVSETQQVIPDLNYRFQNEFMPTSEWGHPSGIWFRLLRLLSGSSTALEFSDVTNAYSDMAMTTSAIEEYGKTLKLISLEGRHLQKLLRNALGLNESINRSNETRKYLDELTGASDLVFLLSSKKASLLFPHHRFGRDQRVYKVASLTSLVSLEIELFSKESMKLKRCAFCGGYFFVKDQRTKYCSYANRTLKGKTCKEAAPQYILQNKTAMHELREKNYNRYEHWVVQFNDERARKTPAYFHRIRELIRDSLEHVEAKQELEAISEEITKIFEAWRNASSKAIDDYFIGKITEDECKAALVVPAIPDRSPKLAYWRKEAKEFQ